MRVPFLDSVVAGLYVADAELVWVSGRRRGRRLHAGPPVREAIEDGDVYAALHRLVACVAPADPHVVTHLDPMHVRHVILEAPDLDEAGLEGWLEGEARHHLPPPARLSDFVLRFQVLEAREGITRCLLALASRRAVEERAALLEAAGLRPLGIGTVHAALSDALWVNPGFAEQRSAVLFLRERLATLLTYEEGILRALEPLPGGTATMMVTALMQEARSRLAPLPDQLLVVGTQAGAFVEQVRAEDLYEGTIREGAGTGAWPGGRVPAAAAGLPSTALALQRLLSISDALNFMAPETVRGRLHTLEKRDALCTMLALAVAVGVFYLLLAWGTAYLEHRLTAVQAEQAWQAGQRAGVEQARAAIRRLERDVARAERLTVERTNVAGVLAGIGRIAPDGLWLDVLTLDRPAAQPAHLTLVGSALHEASLAIYLDRLERLSLAEKVRLRYAEAVPAQRLYRSAGVPPRTVRRFEIQVTLVSSTVGVEVSE